MSQWVKEFAIKPTDMNLLPEQPHGEKRERQSQVVYSFTKKLHPKNDIGDYKDILLYTYNNADGPIK